MYHAPTGGVAVMPTAKTIVRANTRDDGDDGGLSAVKPPPPPIPPPSTGSRFLQGIPFSLLRLFKQNREYVFCKLFVFLNR